MTDNTPHHKELAEEEARRWIVRMASAEMTTGELATFKAWRGSDPAHNRAFEEQRAIWRAAGKQPAIDLAPGTARSTPRHQRPWLRSLPTPRIPRSVAASGIAAALIGGVVFGPDIAITLRADHRASIAIENVRLPDGSKAMLDAGSAISVAYTDGERRIELLRGDAWFEVAHGDRRPFRVAALGGVTQDVGTAFEVRREANAVSVAVTQGAVRLHGPEDGGGLLLRASQRARYGKGSSATRLTASDPANIAAWRQGEILLDKARFADSISEIGRYRSAPMFVMGKPAADQRISGVFRVDRPDEAIDAVAHMAGFSVYRLGKILLLRPID